MLRPQGQAAAMRLVLRRVVGAGGGFAVPPQGHGLRPGRRAGRRRPARRWWVMVVADQPMRSSCSTVRPSSSARVLNCLLW